MSTFYQHFGAKLSTLNINTSGERFQHFAGALFLRPRSPAPVSGTRAGRAAVRARAASRDVCQSVGHTRVVCGVVCVVRSRPVDRGARIPRVARATVRARVCANDVERLDVRAERIRQT